MARRTSACSRPSRRTSGSSRTARHPTPIGCRRSSTSAHWIGDIHHPLHVAFADDEFGASIPVDGLACGKNLHEVWDGCLVEEGLGRNAAGIAMALRRDLPDVLRRDWLRKPLAYWANESYQIVKTPDIGYCVKRLRSCWSTREDAGARSRPSAARPRPDIRPEPAAHRRRLHATGRGSPRRPPERAPRALRASLSGTS